MDGPEVARLVRAAAGGDEGAYEALVREFAPLVWSIARSFRLGAADAGDVTQVVWLRFVENLTRLREPDRAGAWLATTARHECLATVRRSGRTVPVGAEVDPYLEAADPAPDQRLLAGERDHALAEAVATLPDRCRRLFRLLFSEPPPSYEEISAALDVPVGSIGPTRQRCLDRLRAHSEIVRIMGPAGES